MDCPIMSKRLPGPFILNPRHSVDHAHLDGSSRPQYVHGAGIAEGQKIIDRSVQDSVLALAREGIGVRKTAKQLGISPATVSLIRNGKYDFGRNY
jgi:hypothetical protein